MAGLQPTQVGFVYTRPPEAVRYKSSRRPLQRPQRFIRDMNMWKLQSVVLLLAFSRAGGQPGIPPGLPLDPRIPALRTPPSRFILVAPDLLRTDTLENIYLHVDGASHSIDVSISIMDVTKTRMLLRDSVQLGPQNNFHFLKPIQLPSEPLNRDEKEAKHVYLMVNFGGEHTLERKLLVTFHSGYIFIQTDKPIYNPGEDVRLRAFLSSPSFHAMDSNVSVEFKNPEGVVVKQSIGSRAPGGVFRDTFSLQDIASEGTWTVVARFDHWKQNKFTSKFQVKKYVLPAFNVTLTPRKSFLDVNNDNELVVEISARYLYGEPVQGTAYVMFGLKINNEMKRLPLVKQVSELDGGVVKLTMDEIKRTYPNIKSLVGSSIYVKASVLTKTGSDLVEAERTGIHIVDSPYVLSFKDTPQYFKPGLPFDFTIQVSHHDGSPARNVQVKVSHLQDPLLVSDGSTRGAVNMPSVGYMHILTAETVQPGLKPGQQAKKTHRISPYTPQGTGFPIFLYISVGTNNVSVGDRLSLKMILSTAQDSYRATIGHITYLVVNKGKIIQADRIVPSGKPVTSVELTVTPEMMPSFRVVAIYSMPWNSGQELAADSIWVDVADSCVGDLKVGPADGRPRDYAPGESFSFQVRGEPGAKVSLVAVDNAVFLLKKNRLTQRQIWNVVEKGDIGCTHGGSRGDMDVFLDAGLLYASNSGVQSQTRGDLECPGRARRRRSAELLQKKAQLENQYKEQLLQRCCRDGLRDIPMSYSCTRRSLYITEGLECIRAFRHCCAAFRAQAIDDISPPQPTKDPHITLHSLDKVLAGRVRPGQDVEISEEEFQRILKDVEDTEDEEDEEDEEHEEYADETELYLRSRFFESWLWTDFDLPNNPEGDGLASTVMTHALPDSITQWGLMAVSSSPRTGFCVAQPFNFRAWKRFFVDLRLPYSVARNEQVEIKAVVHNYGDEDLHVRVILSKTDGMCSLAFKDKHITELVLPAGSSKVVPYTIVPQVVGKLPLEVAVVGRDMMGGDRIQKMLRVVMEGVQRTEVRSVVLDPAAEGGTQTVHLEKVKLESVVPNSVPETYINIRGNLLADSIENSICNDSLAALIQMPGGCVEQNLARMTLPLIATLYLDRTNDWESVGVNRREEALRYITRGYNHQLNFRRPDGSYPPYRREGPSTWITAYVVKVFSMASSLIQVKKKDVCDPLIYLVKNKMKRPRGNFVEDNPVYSSSLTGGLRGDEPVVTLTAFVVIALDESQQAGIQCFGVGQKVVFRQTALYLSRAIVTPGSRPYTVAIASYALALLGNAAPIDPTEYLLAAAAPGQGYWPDAQNHLFTLEATGYALLALMKLERMEEAATTFKWLSSQRRRGGGYGSTQSTMVVLQALSEYMVKVPIPRKFRLDVDIKNVHAGRQNDIQHHFKRENAYVAQTTRLPAQLDLDVVAKGTGQGVLEAVTYYNQMYEVDEKKPCEHFELSVSIQESSETPPADVEKYFQLSINVRALGPSDVRMVILDISLPTGFLPEYADLERLSNSVDHYISHFEFVDNLSDRGSLIIHLFKVSHSEAEVVTFRLQQAFKVGLLQPSSVTVYEYYNPDHRCSRTYRPSEDREALDTICRENVCRCTQGDCAVSKTDQEIFSNKERETFACKSLHQVFQVKVLGVNMSYYDKYQMEIIQVIKPGVEDQVEPGQKRFFMSHGVCREGLRLTPGSQYLLISPKEDRWEADKDTNQPMYVLGKDTWVEHWPTPTECFFDSSLEEKCNNLDAAAIDMTLFGCLD